jgi:hypothetical protein
MGPEHFLQILIKVVDPSLLVLRRSNLEPDDPLGRTGFLFLAVLGLVADFGTYSMRRCEKEERIRQALDSPGISSHAAGCAGRRRR